MNHLQELQVSYLRWSRSIETILLTDGNCQRVVYIYNFEGIHYRVFLSISAIILFFDDAFEPSISFETEHELVSYLESVELSSLPSDAVPNFVA